MEIQFSRNVKIRIAEAAVLLAIFMIHVWGFWSYDVPIVLLDEFSYWEHAAHFAGYDWTGVITSAPWYAFGYSLLLVPLFFLFEYMSDMYHAAILMNGFMMIGIYFIIKALIRRFYSETSEEIKIAAAAAISLYSAYIGQSQVAWAEITVYFFFWLLLLCFAHLLEKNSLPLCIATSVLTGAIYCIHNRMIVIIIALYMMAVIMKITKKISWKNMLGLMAPAAFLYIAGGLVKTALQSRLVMQTGLEYGVNDISSRAWKVKALFSMDGISNGIKSAMGELVYMNMATFTIGIIGICYILGELFRLWRHKAGSAVEEAGNRFYFLLFVLLSFLGEWGISTLVNMPLSDSIGDKLVTYLYYGRYIDAVVGIILLFGLMHILHHPSKIMFLKIFLTNLVMFAGTIVVYFYSLDFNNKKMKSMCIPGIWYADRIEGMNVILYTAIIEALMLTVFAVYIWGRKPKYKKAFFCGVITVLFLTIGISYSVVRIGAYRQPKEGIFRWAEENIGDEEVYCLKDEKTRYYTQAELYDKEIRVIAEKELPEVPEGSFVVTEKKLEPERFELCMENDTYHIYKVVGED